MPSPVLSVLLGSDQTQSRRYFQLILAIGLFAIVFVGYAIIVFYVSGGLIWIPYYAAVVGMIAACGVGYYHDGLVIAWIVTYTSLLGYHADHASIGLPNQSFVEQLAYFTQLDGLAFLGVEAVVLGTLAFTLGSLLQWVTSFLQKKRASIPDNDRWTENVRTRYTLYPPVSGHSFRALTERVTPAIKKRTVGSRKYQPILNIPITVITALTRTVPQIR